MAFVPKYVEKLFDRLENRGYGAYMVGGCVRDVLLGTVPDDWDVTTSARPEQVMELFGGFAIPTGLKHGTVTVRIDGESIETTTYRSDGVYSDHRRPDTVKFSTRIEDDLERRDFTINALAMNKSGDIIDMFGGREDLKSGIIRCVGNAELRFDEDALRILRALRFSSKLGFEIEEKTAAAMRHKKDLLREIAWERIYAELIKLLCGRNVVQVLLEYPDILGVVIPEILPCVGMDQCTPYHCYDVWEHIARSVGAAPADKDIRLAMMLHDIGKPECFSSDDEGVGHFYMHGEVSLRLAKEVLSRLKADNETKACVEKLVSWHDRQIPCDERNVRRCLSKLGEDMFRKLLLVKRADNLAQHPDYQSRQQELDEIEKMLDSIVARDACFSLKQMAVNGSDLVCLGYSGREIGTELNRLLEDIIDNRAENNKSELMWRAEQHKKTNEQFAADRK